MLGLLPALTAQLHPHVLVTRPHAWVHTWLSCAGDHPPAASPHSLPAFCSVKPCSMPASRAQCVVLFASIST